MTENDAKMSGKTLNRPTKNTLLKVVILGDGGVGKSCIMNRFVSNHFDEHSFHTIGVEFLNKDVEIRGETYTLQIWDTAGQERFKTLRTPFYRGSDICLLTFAIDDRSTFRNLSMWQNEFLYYADIKEDIKFPFIVVGNKSDISQSERQVSQTEIESWCSENSIANWIETSARNADNVQEAFHMAVLHWSKMEKSAERDACFCSDTVDLRNTRPPENRSSCCLGTTDE